MRAAAKAHTIWWGLTSSAAPPATRLSPIVNRGKGQTMRIYIFKSETRGGLRAFAGDLTGSKLPQNHGPWTATGAIGPDNTPPHNFSRAAIEEAIDTEGFQLWRMVKKTEAPA